MLQLSSVEVLIHVLNSIRHRILKKKKKREKLFFFSEAFLLKQNVVAV
jgi:hypothetical protein